MFISPKGKKLRSKQELRNYIERHKIEVNLDEFIFASGINRRKKAVKSDTINNTAKRIRKPKVRPKKIEEISEGEFIYYYFKYGISI